MSNEDFAEIVEKEARELWEMLKPATALSPIVQRVSRRLLSLYQQARTIQQTAADLPVVEKPQDPLRTSNVNPLQQPPRNPGRLTVSQDERDRILRETKKSLQPILQKIVEWETSGNLNIVDVTQDELTECDIITGPPEDLSSKVKKYP